MRKILITLFAITHSFIALSQSSLEVTLLDKNNEPVALQDVIITNEQIGYEQKFITSQNGKVQADGLSTSGLYEIKALGGEFYHPVVKKNVSLISDQTKTVTIVMREKRSELQTVTVSADDYRTINTVDAEVNSELSEKEIRELPVEGRDITRTLYRLPNISQATGFFPEAPNVAINGANTLYTNYQIDGLENNENFLGGQRFAIPVGFTKNITALTNNFSAEHGLTSNGIINITTKSGTNDFSGEAFYVTRPGPVIDAPSAFAQRDLSGNQVKDGFQRHQVGFAFGGPIKKDKTFYFVNVEHTTDLKDNLLNVPQLRINETVRGTNEFTYISGKIDHNWSQRFRSSLRVNTGLINIERQGGGLDGGVTFPSAGNTQNRNSLNVAFKNTYNGEDFTLESNYQYGRFRWNYANPANPGSPNVTVLDPNEITIANLGHPGFVFDETENTLLTQQKITLYKGDHRIKAGVQIKSSGFELFGGGNPNGSYTVKLNQSQLQQLRESGVGSDLMPGDIPTDAEVLNYGVELRPNSFEQRQTVYSVYAEDQWSVNSRLNVNLGLRYDYDDLSKGGADQGDLNNIAPRLSVNYKLDEKSSLRAGYGIYYSKIIYSVYSDALQFSSTSRDFQQQLELLIDHGTLPENTDIDRVINDGNLVGNRANVDYLEGPDASELQGQREDIFSNELRILNPNGYDNPFSHQMMLGYQRKLNEKSLFYVDVMHNRSYNLFRLRNVNAPAPYKIDPNNVIVRSQAAADQERTVPVFTDPNTGEQYAIGNGEDLNGAARNVVMTESEGRSNYYAMNVTYQKDRADDDYSLRLMYTLSFLENNTEDINFRAMDANDFEDEWGPSINDRRHLINGIFSYFPVEKLNLTMAALLQSGQPINRIPDATIYGTTDLNGDGRAFGEAYVGNSDRSPGESRNNDRLPWSATFDFSARYTWDIGSNGQQFELGAQVFNLFNAENLSGYSNNATQSNQIQAGPADSGRLVIRNAAPPRQFQFSVRYLF